MYRTSQDPTWTESNWPDESPRLRLYLRERPGLDSMLVFFGLALTAVSAGAAVMANSVYASRLKSH